MPRPASLLLLLLACQPTPQPAPEASKPAPVAAPEKVSDVAWWCTCYTRSGPTAVTSCRTNHADCRRVEDQARSGGGSAIIPGSLTHRCREIRGDHPGDVLGSRDGWQKIEKSGSWVSQGACLLPGPPDAPPPPVPQDTHSDERFGALALDQSDAAVREALGAPTTTVEPGADVPFTLAWEYPDRGLALTFTADQRTGPWKLESVRAKPPCDLRTSRGIGLGDPRRSVEAAYLKDNPFPMRPNAPSFLAVTPAHTLQFDFDPNTGALIGLQMARTSK